VTPTFSALSNRNFRLFVTGQMVSNTGTWMQRVAQDWLVLSLTHQSGTALGITTALQFLPILLFTLWGGVLADRLPKRKVLLGTQAVMGLQALALGLLTVTGHAQVWHVYVLASVLGLAAALDTPVRQAFVSEMVGKRDLPNAVALGSATFNLGRVIGPAVAGVLITWIGTGPVFLVNSVSFLAVITGLLMMRGAELWPSARVPRGPGALREGLTYVRGRRDLLLVIVLAGAVGTFGFNFQISTALMATHIFHKGASAFGLLTTAFALGSLIGALLSARRAGSTGSRPGLRLVVGLALGFGVLETVSGFAPSYAAFFVLLIPTGLLAIAFATSANAFVQLGVDPTLRGRVMAIYMLAFFGGTPIGAPFLGWLAEAAGARWSLLGGGLGTLVCTVIAVALLRPRTEPMPQAEASAPGAIAIDGRVGA
jgi:MFS family permease